MLKVLKAEQGRILQMLPETDPRHDGYKTLLSNLNEVCYLLNAFSEPVAQRFGALQDEPKLPGEEKAEDSVVPFSAPDAPTDAAEAYTEEKKEQEAEYEPITAAQCREALSNIRINFGVDVNTLVHEMTEELGVAKFTEIKDGVKYAELVARAMKLTEES